MFIYYSEDSDFSKWMKVEPQNLYHFCVTTICIVVKLKRFLLVIKLTFLS